MECVSDLNSSTSLTLAWGNPAANSIESYTYDGSVWTNGFAGVYHMGQAVLGKQSDSSPSANHATDSGFVDGNQTTPVVAAYRTQGSGSAGALTTPSGSLNSVQEGSYTISGWFKRSSASAGYPNAFLARGYNGGQSDGVLNNINTMITRAYDGQRIWTTEDLFIDGDGQFRNAGVGITQNDNFMFLAMSTFVVPETGAYRFKMEWKDDRAVGWMDLNKNNTFDLASEKLGGNNNWESAVLNLTAGDKHLFATAMAEWGGGSRHRSLIKTPSITSYALIDPSSAAQDGMWIIDPAAPWGVGYFQHGSPVERQLWFCHGWSLQACVQSFQRCGLDVLDGNQCGFSQSMVPCHGRSRPSRRNCQDLCQWCARQVRYFHSQFAGYGGRRVALLPDLRG